MIDLLIYTAAWCCLHSILAAEDFKDVTRRLLGASGFRFYRLFYNLFSLASLLPLVALFVRTPDRLLYGVPMPWSGVMLLGELFSLLALFLAFRQTDPWDFLGLRQLSREEALRPGRLVAEGFYRYVRHPLYTAGLLVVWLFPYMTVNLFGMSLLMTIYVLVGAGFEERRLRRAFGQAYLDYQAATPMFIPFLKGNKGRPKAS